MPATIRPMRPDERPEMLAVTARAFWCDPLFDFFTRDLLHEYRLLPPVFRLYFKHLRAELAQVCVADHDGGPRGVAGWLPPGALPRSALREAQRSIRAARVASRVQAAANSKT